MRNVLLWVALAGCWRGEPDAVRRETSAGESSIDAYESACVITAAPADATGVVGTAVVVAIAWTGDCEFSWTLAALPVGSALTSADLSDAATDHPSFTPDVAGRFSLSLVAYDGTHWGVPDYVNVDVDGS